MNLVERKSHWDHIYHTNTLEEAGWYQPVPHTSIQLIESLDLSADASVMDAGGGDSFLVDYLLDQGYASVSVLDISVKAIQRAKERLGPRADKVNWIEADIATFIPTTTYQLWHDRAAFHFLTGQKEIHHYVNTLAKGIPEGGYLVIGTFSKTGPAKCSGLDIHQYDEQELTVLLYPSFEKIKCIEPEHLTPGGKIQHYIFCCFRRKRSNTH